MTLKVKADLKIEHSDLNYLCSHPSLASKCFPEMIDTDGRNGANYDPLTCVASLQVKIVGASLPFKFDFVRIFMRIFSQLNQTPGP